MSLEERLASEMKQAMKARDSRRLGCIRMLRSKVQEKAVAARAKPGGPATLDDDDVIAVISAYAKQRRDSIEAYRKAGRDDLAAGEEAELAIIQEYLPARLSESELAEIVAAAVAESGASSAADLGRVMKLVMPQVRGRADGKQINAVARRLIEQAPEA